MPNTRTCPLGLKNVCYQLVCNELCTYFVLVFILRAHQVVAQGFLLALCLKIIVGGAWRIIFSGRD